MNVMTSAPLLDTDEEFNLGEIFGLVASQWRKIAVITAICTALAIFNVMRAHPAFTVAGTLYLGDAQAAAGGDTGGSGGLGFLQDFRSVSDVDTQVELIKSKALIEQAVLQTGLNVTIMPGVAHPPFWKWAFFNHGAIDAYEPPANGLQALSATFTDPGIVRGNFKISFQKAGHYTITSGSGWFVTPRTVLTGRLGQPATGGGLSLVINPIVGDYTPPSGSAFSMSVVPASKLAEQIAGGQLSVLAGGTVAQPTSIAQLTLSWWDPYQGSRFLNQLMQDFIATRLAWKTESASATQSFIAGQLDKIKSSLATADKNLAAYQAQTGLIDVPENAKADITWLAQSETQSFNLQLQQLALRRLVREISGAKGALDPFILAQADSPALGQLAAELADANAKLQMLDAQFTGDATELQVQAAQVAALKSAIRSLITNQLATAETNLVNLNAQIAQFNDLLKSVPAEALRVTALTRDSNVFGQLYEFLVQKEEEAEVSKAATTVDTRVVSPAEVPLTVAKPKAQTTIILGLILGLFFSIALILAQRSFSPSFQSDDEIRRTARRPVYGFIPSGNNLQAHLYYPQDPNSALTEAFRLLRTRLFDAGPRMQPVVVMLTSAGPREGRIFTSINLAKAIAETGKKILLIDADLHGGRLHELFGIPPQPGLADWLMNGEKPPLRLPAGQKFAVLPAGKPGAGMLELLERDQFAGVLNRLRTEFDFILIDSPPLPAVADSLAIAGLADVILSVAATGRTLRRAWRIHNELLAPLNRTHGVVINGTGSAAFGLDAARQNGRSASAVKRSFYKWRFSLLPE